MGGPGSGGARWCKSSDVDLEKPGYRKSLEHTIKSKKTDRDIIRLRSQGQTFAQIQVYLETKRGVKLTYQAVQQRYHRALARVTNEEESRSKFMKYQQLDKADMIWTRLVEEMDNGEELSKPLVSLLHDNLAIQNKILGVGLRPTGDTTVNVGVAVQAGEGDWQALVTKEVGEMRRQGEWAEGLLLGGVPAAPGADETTFGDVYDLDGVEDQQSVTSEDQKNAPVDDQDAWDGED